MRGVLWLGYAICDKRDYLVDVLGPIVDARDESDQERLTELEGRSEALIWIPVACFGNCCIR